MGRGSNRAKGNAKPAVPRKSQKHEDGRVRDLEKRLTEALQRETEGLKREAEAQEQQAATAEILRVISSSPTDVQPVFDVIVRSAVRLCDGLHAAVFRFDGQLVHLAAHHNVTPEALVEFERVYPLPPSRESLSARAILDRSVVHVPDVERDPDASSSRRLGQATSYRSVLSVPMLRDGIPIGGISVGRAQVGPFSDRQIDLVKTFADQAVIAIENVRLFKELETRNNALTEALEQQTATSEILRVISSSPTDVQPVLEMIAQRSGEVCGGFFCVVFMVQGDHLHLRASHNIPTSISSVFASVYPAPLTSPLRSVQAVREGCAIAVADMQDEAGAPPGLAERSRAYGLRSWVAVPMMRGGRGIGAIAVGRREMRPFSEKDIALLQTFADQAVIAVENVRLFRELQASNRDLTEALDQQTATSEVLRVISQSPTDTQPVFQAIVESAVRLCHGTTGSVLMTEEQQVHLRADVSFRPETRDAVRARFPFPLSRSSLVGRAIVDGELVHVPDFEVSGSAPESARTVARMVGYRSALATPMFRDGRAIGLIFVGRADPGRFSEDEIRLLRTFADQAVIAVENVRLFKELEARNRDLTVALEQQTATSEILSVISSSPTDIQPVFDTIVKSVARLCDGMFASLHRLDGDLLHWVAQHNYTAEGLEAMRKRYPMRAGRDTASGRAVIDRTVIHIGDFESDPDAPPGSREIARAFGYRSLITVPMLREGQPVGAIAVARRDGPFSAGQIALLKTFADQAVIAIENVRLFKELEARTQDLTRSVGELRALGEVGQAISSTLNLRTVLSMIVARATQLSGTDAGVIYEYDEQREVFVPHATEHLEAEIVETMLATPVRKGEGATGQLAEVHEPIQLPDISEAPAESRVRGALVRAGYRALLAVPLVREDHLLGGLTVIRKATGAFAPETIELLRTFATQSSLAIQNARLFLEIEDKSRQLEAASQHKSEFLANMSHELRTPLNAIIGFSEVLSERMFGELNEKQEEYLKDIHASGQHLLSLINDILDLSKIEAGRMELELSDFSLPATLDNALTLVRERAGRHGIALHVTTDERVGQVRADERKIRQVILNLLSNAIKFTPEGGRIDVRAGPGDGVVEVSVSDTGVGIAPEDQEAIFEEFRQVGTAAKKVEGTGLGLALSRKFIELHGGRIWVHSQVGAGSTFTFTIPMRRGE